MTGTYVLAVCSFLLIALISILSYKERRELLTRIMCKDAREYKELTEEKEKPQTAESLHKKSVDAFHKKGLDN